MFVPLRYRRFLTRPAASARLAGCLCMFAILFAVAGCGGGSDDAPASSRAEKIVFVSNEGEFSGINTINLDGTGRKLVFAADSSLESPSFSPDGTKIAFLSNRENCGGVGCKKFGNGPASPSQMWLINADGTGLRQITRADTGGGSGKHYFSPDGSRILYNSHDNSPDGVVPVLRSVQIDGNGDTILVRGKANNDAYGGYSFEASLSPDGSKVLFVADRDGDPAIDSRHIYVMNRDGSGEVQLTDGPLSDYSPSFSPDGSRIKFSRKGYLLEVVSEVFSELYVMNADGTGQTRLTDNTDYERTSSFSPDGTKIVYTSWDSNDWRGRLFVMNADGTDQRPIPRGDGSGGSNPNLVYIAQHGAWALAPVR